MLEVQKFLQLRTSKYMPYTFAIVEEIHIAALEDLKEQYGIKYNIWENKLVVLNYDQIESSKHKFHPIVRECRSLVLELGSWDVVSRSFNRFYNQREEPDCKYQVENLVAYEKVDGSLISFFNYKGEWLYRTKSMIMPDSVINDNVGGVTWKDAIESAVNIELFELFPSFLTFIFELVCKENRVVVKYEHETPKLYYLACRASTGEYDNRGEEVVEQFCKNFNFIKPKKYTFDTLDHCLQSAKELRNLEEGYVMYKDGVPVMKVKNPAYVAAHHLRGNGPLTEKRVLDIIVMNEQDEYLSIFPEDYKDFEPYINALSDLQAALVEFKNKINSGGFDGWSQKEFALEVKDLPYSSIAFKMKQGKTFKEAWEGLTTNSKHNMILAYK